MEKNLETISQKFHCKFSIQHFHKNTASMDSYLELDWSFVSNVGDEFNRIRKQNSQEVGCNFIQSAQVEASFRSKETHDQM